MCFGKVSYGRLLENPNAPFGERWSPVATKINVIRFVNPIWPSLFWCIRDLGGGAHCAPLNIFGLVGVRVPIFFGNDLARNDLPYSKGFMKFGCPEPSKKMFDF